MRFKLAVIVLAQFFCTSVWFAANAVFPSLIEIRHLPLSFLADLTSAIQFGFITGTLSFAVLTISDRYSPSTVFFICALGAAFCNVLIIFNQIPDTGFLFLRFLTGFFMAGIYPVGMKIASDYVDKGLGISLGFLVGALVLGSAFPHFIKSMIGPLPWHWVMIGTSALAILGGMSILLWVPNGPFRKKGQGIRPKAFLEGFKNPHFKAAAFGYFGHMWELYSFWAFVPFILIAYQKYHGLNDLDISFYAFLIIAAGSIACAVGGLFSTRFGSKNIATVSLAISCFCCLTFPLFWLVEDHRIFLSYLFVWGFAVVADSPQFSTLIARYAPPESRGTALTIVNCIGFSLTIVSIQTMEFLSRYFSTSVLYTFLALGPLFGLFYLWKDYTTNRKISANTNSL